IYVPPQKTSSTCAICGSKITECAERKVYCPECDRIVDRDANAASNILARGLRFKPFGPAVEAVNQSKEDVEQMLVSQVQQSKTLTEPINCNAHQG
ncbi:MAG TPA: zinc ribbon domain-containing protein, partial [archaeon]|nr:zinc ribbon domain-containing protein [archaeon]